VRILQNTSARPVTGVSFGPAGRTLVAGGSGGYDVWDLASGSHAFVPSHGFNYSHGCVADPLGRWFYVSDDCRWFRLVPLPGGPQPPPDPVEQHAGAGNVYSFDVTPDGSRLVMGRGVPGMNRVECWDVRRPASFRAVWSLEDGKPVPPDKSHSFNSMQTWVVHAVAICPGGGTVAMGECPDANKPDSEPFIVLREGASGRAVARLGRSAGTSWTRLAFVPDGRALFVWDPRLLERWDVTARGRVVRVPHPGRASFWGLAVHPSGRLVLTASGDGVVRYWDATTLALVRALRWGIGKLHAVAVSPDGAVAAAGGDKGQVVVWDVDV
jgi:WD40 repeat protein